MGVNAHIASCAREAFMFAERYVLLRRRIDVFFSKTKVDHMYNVLLPVGVPANQKVLWLYVTIDELFWMDVLYPWDLQDSRFPQPGDKYKQVLSTSWDGRPFGHNRHGPKIGVLCPFFGRGELGSHLKQCGLGRCLPKYQVASSSIQSFGHNRRGTKIGSCAPIGGELGPYLTQCGLGRGLPPYQVVSWSIQPFGHNRHEPKIAGMYPLFGGSWVSI